mgnify:CR=1 FL=1
MSIYLPIAEVSVNAFLLLGLGGIVGVLSGMFGVGGGFLMTPLLFFIGIPPAVAVATEANQIVASSFSGALAHFRRGTVDIKLGLMLLLGGIAGAGLGVLIFGKLRELGQLDLIISILYVVFLGTIGSLMVVESLNAIRKSRRKGDQPPPALPKQQSWIANLPLKMRFERSQLYLSAIPVVVLGMLVGILASIMGVGGGFIMVPAMLYLLGMGAQVVVGTSLFQILFVTMSSTMMHSLTTKAVDIVLSVFLLLGSVVGAQIGARFAQRMKPEYLRLALSIIVLLVGVRMALGLAWQPDEIYTVQQL